jgi:flagellar basal-body rod protein FlgF
MDNSIYIALSRQTALFRDLEISANNIANANTTGYSTEKVLFSPYLVKDGKRDNAYANDVTSYRDTTTGPIKLTGNPFDLAITGNGYFQVQTPQGARYTKSGNFQLDAQGIIVTPSGFPVLGKSGGPITIPATAKDVVINGAGEVVVDGEQAGQIGIFEFKNEQTMKRVGNSMYSSEEPAQQSITARIAQGALEGSNVSPVTELVRVQELSRSAGSTAKFISSMFELQRKAATAYAKPQG